MKTLVSRAAMLKVKDIMTPEPICVSRSATVHEITKLFVQNEISAVPVVDDQDRVLGIVSKTDVLNACLEGPPGSPPDIELWEILRTGASATALNPEDVGVAEDLMRSDEVTARATETVAAVATRMTKNRNHHVVVTDDSGEPVGIVTSLDMIKLLAG